MQEVSSISSILTFIQSNPWVSSLAGTVITGLVGTGIFSFKRRAKPEEEKIEQYFTEPALLSPPLTRPAYSDRMAYVLAEMSDLVYFKFEGAAGVINEAVEDGVKTGLDDVESIRGFLEKFSTRLLSDRELGKDLLVELLKKSGFKLLTTINVRTTQGFICKRVPQQKGQQPYIIIAFRGTEKKISDWLTNAQAKPAVEGDTKVHTGFMKAFSIDKGEDGKSVIKIVRETVKDNITGDDGKDIPVFITGHSLGGALAMLATKNLFDDINGACYTYGAPRLANYEYFSNVKTPVFRLVNSSDIVPRVPPGAGILVLIKLVQGLSWATGFIPVISSIFDKLEGVLDKLNGYRHFGDLRYLTDVATGRFEDVRLLSNPPAIDRLIWMWAHIRASFWWPVKSHSMFLYRSKLKIIANDRN